MESTGDDVEFVTNIECPTPVNLPVSTVKNRGLADRSWQMGGWAKMADFASFGHFLSKPLYSACSAGLMPAFIFHHADSIPHQFELDEVSLRSEREAVVADIAVDERRWFPGAVAVEHAFFDQQTLG